MAETNTYEVLRAQLDEEQWSLSDAFRAATHPEERARIMAALKASIAEGGLLAAAHRGEHTGSLNPTVLRVLLEALEREHEKVRAELLRANQLIARVALALADDSRELPPLPPSLWRGLHEYREAAIDVLRSNTEKQELVRELLARLGGGSEI